MSYEKEQARLQRLYEEVEADDSPPFDDCASEGSLESDDLEIQDINCDSEQEFDSDSDIIRREQQQAIDDHITVRVPSFISKNGTRWKKHAATRNVRTRAQNIVVNLPRVKGRALKSENSVQIWDCFFTEDVLEIIVQSTNIYIEMKRYRPENNTARKTDILEMRAFIGLLYMAGVNKNSHRNAADLFRTNGTSLEIYRLTMSLARFQFLLGHIRFDDKRTREERQKIDKLAAFREVFEIVNANWSKNFSFSEYCTVDEMLPAFRGKCPFRIYMPSKPNKYGIKLYALVDAKMFYCGNMEVYIGKQHPGPYKLDTSNAALLPRICNPISGTNRNVTMDNFFTSKLVAEILLNDHKLTIIGTMRKNKPEIPTEFHHKRPKNTSMFAFQQNFTLVSYTPKPRKNVIVMSTMHYDDAINPNTGKPEIIMDYNSTKSGVDILDKMNEAYNCARATCRWPMVLFYTLLNVAGINSYIIFKNKNLSVTKPRRLFLENLAMELLDGHIRRRAIQENIPKGIKLRLREICGITVENNPKPVTYGRCYLCGSKKNRKTKFSCEKCNKYMCMEHIKCICPECLENVDDNLDE